MEIAITGGNGRLGQALIKHLLQINAADGRPTYRIRSLDWVETPPEKRLPGVQHIKVNLAFLDGLLEPLWGCQAIAHLAAYTGPYGQPPGEVYINNTSASYNVLWAAATLGIQKVCLASSVNALGGAGSRIGRYDYFPVDEAHPTYNEDDYGLSKWVMEQQADSFARRYPWMTISSLRLHALPDETPTLENTLNSAEEGVARTLWGWTLMSEAARACELALKASFQGHEVFYITAPITGSNIPSLELARHAYPQVPVRGDLADHKSFFDCSKAARLLGWVHCQP